MESMLDELRFGQRTMEDPHAAMWEDGQWRPEGIPGGRRDVTR